MLGRYGASDTLLYTSLFNIQLLRNGWRLKRDYRKIRCENANISTLAPFWSKTLFGAGLKKKKTQRTEFRHDCGLGLVLIPSAVVPSWSAIGQHESRWVWARFYWRRRVFFLWLWDLVTMSRLCCIIYFQKGRSLHPEPWRRETSGLVSNRQQVNPDKSVIRAGRWTRNVREKKQSNLI